MKDQTFFTKDQCSICYQYHLAHPSSPTLILLHGLGGDFSVWEPIVPHFIQAGYSCLLIDLRGFGFSDRKFPHSNVSLDLYADDVARLCQHLKLTSPICLGHCFGGNVAIHLAAKINLSALILLAVGLDPKPTTLYQSLLFDFGQAVLSLLIHINPPHHPYRWTLSRNLQDIDFVRLTKDVFRTHPRSYATALRAIRQGSSIQEFKKLRLPIYAFHGLHDWIIPNQQAQADYAKHPTTQYIGLDTNHLIPQNIPPDVLADQILLHLKKIN